MKRGLVLLTAFLLLWALAACGGSPDSPDPSQTVQGELLPQEETAAQPEKPEPAEDEPRVLVACFSATGNTREVARHLEAVLGADLYEILPEDPYTSEDLDYRSDECRANLEQNDPAARPAIRGGVDNMGDYDAVFLGYPIWWGQAPKILHTFLESYDFTGKTIVPFCTSGSSGIGSSAENLRPLAPGADWLEGQRFEAGASREEVAAWVEGLNLDGEMEPADGETELLLTFDGGEAVVALTDNATTRDFLLLLPASLTFADYAGTEKISYLERELSTADKPASYDPRVGDVTLYAPWGNLAIFYGEAGSSSGLVPMGRVVSGLERLAAMEGEFTVSVSVR